jgi:hypothetical protein
VHGGSKIRFDESLPGHPPAHRRVAPNALAVPDGLGPGLLVTLADTDVGNIVNAAQWGYLLVLVLVLVLQVNFLIPPMGNAVMMARIKAPQKGALKRWLPAKPPY